jgi:hypothetical protein
MKFANATNLDRKSGVAQWRDLLFHFRAQQMCRGQIASRFRFPINANSRVPILRRNRERWEPSILQLETVPVTFTSPRN